MTTVPCEHPRYKIVVNVIFNYKKQKAMNDCMQLYNVLFGRLMNQLEMVQMNRNYYSLQHGNTDL